MRAEREQGQSSTQEGRHESIGIPTGAQAGGIEEHGIGLEELGRIGVGEVVGGAEKEVGIVVDVSDGAALFVGRMAAGVGNGDVVDEVAVVGVVGLEGAESGFGGIEVVFEAGIVDDPEVGDDVSDDAAAAIAVDDVVDNQSRRSIGGGGVVGAGTEVEDDAVAVGVMSALVDFAGDDVVGDDVVEAGVVIEPLVGVVGDSAGPAVPLGVGGTGRDEAGVVGEVVIGGEVVAVDGSDTGAAGIGDGVGDEAKVVRAAAEEGIGGIGIDGEVEDAGIEISGAGREGGAETRGHR